MIDRLRVKRLSYAFCALILAQASVVVAQEESDCPTGTGPVPVDDPTAQQVALLLGSKWYNHVDHVACDYLPTNEFLDSINVTQACVDPPYTAETVPEGSAQTFFVSFDGTVPCSKEGKETLLKENPDIPFTLQFEAEATYPSPGDGDGMLKGELVGPENKPLNWSISAPIKDSDACPEGTKKGKTDDPSAMSIAKGVILVFYNPENHKSCGAQPMENFLSSIKLTNVCKSPDGNLSVSFDATLPCTEEGKTEKLLEVPLAAFTFQFEATGDKDGNPTSASVVGGDGKLTPPFKCPSDECTFTTRSDSTPPGPGSPEQEQSSAGAHGVLLSVLACIVSLIA